MNLQQEAQHLQQQFQQLEKQLQQLQQRVTHQQQHQQQVMYWRSGRPLPGGYYSEEHDSDDQGSNNSDGHSSDENDPDDSVGDKLHDKPQNRIFDTPGLNDISEMQCHVGFRG